MQATWAYAVACGPARPRRSLTRDWSIMVHGSRARGQWSVCHWPGLQMKDKPLSVAQVGHPTELVQRLGREQRLDERRRRGEGPEGEVMDLSE